MANIQMIYQELIIKLEGLLYKLLFHQYIPPVPLPQLVNSMRTAQ